MEVKTENGGTFDAAGNGTKALGIIGTVLGGAALASNGLLGTFTGNNNKNCGCGCDKYVTQKEMQYAQAYDVVLSDLKQEKSERYTDQAVIAERDRAAIRNKEQYDTLIQIGNAISTINANLNCLNEKLSLKEQILDMKIKNAEEKCCSAVALESERRVNGDQGLYGYVNATFVPGKLIMPSTSICPSVMPEFNSWTAPTTSNATA